MELQQSKIVLLLKTYKWMLLPVIPMLIFVVLLIILFTTPKSQTISQQQQQQQSGNANQNGQLNNNQPSDVQTLENKDADNAEDLQADFQKKQVLNDGTVVYSYKSDTDTRPNLVITSKSGETIYTRTLNSKERPLATVAEYQQAYGDSENVVRGSKTYGDLAVTYIYASLGLAVIADQSTGTAYEEQTFTPMRVDEYLQLYGSQN